MKRREVNARAAFSPFTNQLHEALGVVVRGSVGRIGPPLQLIVDGEELRQRTIRSCWRDRYRVVYDHVDAEHDCLIYRVVAVL
jgi:hypothetical protein